VAGGSTTIPEWTLEPEPGVAEHTETVPQHLVTALGERADEVGVPPRAVLVVHRGRVLAGAAGSGPPGRVDAARAPRLPGRAAAPGAEPGRVVLAGRVRVLVGCRPGRGCGAAGGVRVDA